MAATTRKKLSAEEAEQAFELQITDDKIQAGESQVYVWGISPFIFNAVSFKAKQELLFPSGRKTEAERSVTAKHDPLAEYRSSVYRRRDKEPGPTRLVFPCPAFKGVLGTAALDYPSARISKAKLGRLTWITGVKCDVWGTPQLLMAVVRNSDINHTPDIRTRAILPEWGMIVNIRYITPMVKENAISALMQMGGLTCGVGDGRQEKGKLSFGQFELVRKDDPRFLRLQKTAGMKAQDEALENPDFFDYESEELFSWWQEERVKREGMPKKAPRSRRTKEVDDAIGEALAT